MPEFPQNPYFGQIVTWQGVQYQWNGEQWFALPPPDPSTVPVYFCAEPPQPPLFPGSFWYDTTNSTLNIWSFILGQNRWSTVTKVSEGLPFVSVSTSPPANPLVGALWFHPYLLNLSIWSAANSWKVVSQPPTSNVLVSSIPPVNPSPDLIWYDREDNRSYTQVSTVNGIYWAEVGNSTYYQAKTITVSFSTPSSPSLSQYWWQPQVQELRVWTPGNEWKQVFDNTATEQIPPVSISVVEPTFPRVDYLWFNPETKELKVFSGTTWGLVSSGGGSTSSPVAVSVLPPNNPQEGYLWFNPTSGVLSVWCIGNLGGEWVSTTPSTTGGEVLIDSSSEPGTIYVGRAPSGSLQTAPVWTIYRSIFDSSGNLLSAESASNVAWSDRQTVIYS